MKWLVFIALQLPGVIVIIRAIVWHRQRGATMSLSAFALASEMHKRLTPTGWRLYLTGVLLYYCGLILAFVVIAE